MKGLLLFGLLLNLPFFGNKTESYQILIALGCSAPRSVQNSYREMLAYEVLPNLLGEKPLGVRVQLILAAITGRSYTAPVRVLETPDPMQSNRFTIEKRVQELKKETLVVFDQLRSRTSAECRKGTEIIGALKAAGERARGPGRILVLAHGFEQSELMNLYDYNLKLERPEVRANLIERVRNRLGLPKLKDQEVCFAGLTAGDDRNANSRLTGSMRLFWEELITASGGKLVGYGVSPRTCPFL
ncbi:hypothetical protein [Meiothermus taiwanensis]|uniref:Uncharacterized protein n=2 Tax=Meiothermus taiwanensis TaxID=172827 RepID=A0A399E2Z6_9DEIN|nr:hypothetical protein [Meiothermus taiwanensis]AWR87991.1 hypothetical protein Mtai_v1c27660 [Meiothermus taiwanensis WR-220]KIQ54976.1 hypothetical protein SY28_05815 [Meiothermus taiwanensis]KZK15110.1 hypothetical protein A3962_11415 [Meiothermus taiwanensis]RIH76990.1 hypothetical protein Mcate_01538 [Meiothermus taiwanensis]